MIATRITKRTAALTAVLALLLAGLWGLGSTQQARADITTVNPTVYVANVSPPQGGSVIYGITVTTDATANTFDIEVTNMAGFDVAATDGACYTGSSDATVVDASPVTCTTINFNTGVRFSGYDDLGADDTATVYLKLLVGSSTAVGSTLQPTFKVIQGTDEVVLQAPARTVGAATASASVTEATIGDTVTFTFTLPPGWTCGSDGAENATRACVATDVTSTSNLSLVASSFSPSNTNLYAPATITINGTITGVGAATATLSVIYHGETGLPAPLNNAADNSNPPDPSATVNVWIGIVTPASPLPGEGAVYTGTSVSFAIANLFSAPATSATATLTFPPQFTGVQVTANPTGWTCSASGNTITCTTNSSTTIASGGTVALLNGGTNGNLSVVLTANPSALNTRSFQLQASVSYDFGGPTMSKSATKTLTQGVLRVDVSVAPFPTVLPNSATGVVLYTLNLDDVTPESPDPVLGNVQIVFSAPPEALQIVGVTGVAAGWSCTTSGLQVTCTRAGVSGFNGPVSGGVATVAVQLPANTGTGMVARTANVSATFDIYGTVGSTNVQTGAAIAALGNPGSDTVFHPGTGIGTVSYNLVFGWNLITWAGQNNIAVGSPNGLGSIVSSISAVYTFDALTQQWRYWFPTPPASGNTLTTLQTGTAYFIYVTAPGGATLTVPAGP